MTRVIAGEIGPARGLRGEVFVKPRTDEPENRFYPGASVWADDKADMEIERVRVVSGRLCVTFAGVTTREQAESMRGVTLWVDACAGEDEYYPHDVAGLAVVDEEGTRLGTVVTLIPGAAQDLLVVDAHGREVLVPFVTELVPHIDTEAGVVTVHQVPGLFDEE
ncbi:MAG: ribosome maturation factor RimM [Actinomycetaceae bacterium]|nr:ribosome maturation factor RimM [Actinomycetaceae bacterium]